MQYNMDQTTVNIKQQEMFQTYLHQISDFNMHNVTDAPHNVAAPHKVSLNKFQW